MNTYYCSTRSSPFAGIIPTPAAAAVEVAVLVAAGVRRRSDRGSADREATPLATLGVRMEKDEALEVREARPEAGLQAPRRDAKGGVSRQKGKLRRNVLTTRPQPGEGRPRPFKG